MIKSFSLYTRSIIKGGARIVGSVELANFGANRERSWGGPEDESEVAKI